MGMILALPRDLTPAFQGHDGVLSTLCGLTLSLARRPGDLHLPSREQEVSHLGN